MTPADDSRRQEDPERIGATLRRVRAGADITLREAAALVGVSERTLYAWERGAAMPPLDKAVALARVYEVSIVDLVDDIQSRSIKRSLTELAQRMDELQRQINPTTEGPSETQPGNG